MDAPNKPIIEHFARLTAVMDKLAAQLTALRQTLEAEREVNARALAAMMVRIEQLEERQ